MYFIEFIRKNYDRAVVEGKFRDKEISYMGKKVKISPSCHQQLVIPSQSKRNSKFLRYKFKCQILTISTHHFYDHTLAEIQLENLKLIARLDSKLIS